MATATKTETTVRTEPATTETAAPVLAPVTAKATRTRKKPAETEIEKTIKDKTILWGEVIRTGWEKEEPHRPYMLVESRGRSEAEKMRCIIYRDEADADFKSGSIEYLIGRRIPYIILSEDKENHRVVGSRKQAQEFLKTDMLQRLADGKEMNGTILNLVNFGAFVEVGGVVGLLKNTDFSSDYSEISEYYRPGDSIRVKCKEINGEGKIFWTVEDKRRRTTPINYDFEPNTSVIGTVKAIRVFPNSTGAFVRIARGLDALCTIPDNVDPEVGSKVSVRIFSVNPSENEGEPPKVRGRIICCI